MIRHLSLLCMTVALVAGAALARPALAADVVLKPVTVLELFTSQGCSSCPPADALLNDLATRDGVLGLSFHVDYWDYIGWKDTFALAETTARQRAYGAALGASYVYTPQVVVGGRAHEVGSNRAGIERLIASDSDRTQSLGITARIEDGVLVLSLPPHEGGAWLWQVDIDRNHEVAIQRGENSGRTVRYHNVVRNLNRIAAWDGSAREYRLDLDAIRRKGRDGCAILVQQDGYGPIIGALEIAFDASGS
ncbi:DUF1223 domain-containing protein [Oceanibacterium hippocampi]|uniref:DUF1223 domain-containing protein n=1 Tax=Oceanibacterium hippocampi TaxID=745714 RepID=A0A1Y5RDW2_9PROT|nr:DUF1223 domain-containing protein [Oceanibacterium hippocampi]SLN14796.1 hypothetical protein OCH7691_00288 [Oceanibacterium hippocampi]